MVSSAIRSIEENSHAAPFSNGSTSKRLLSKTELANRLGVSHRLIEKRQAAEGKNDNHE